MSKSDTWISSSVRAHLHTVVWKLTTVTQKYEKLFAMLVWGKATTFTASSEAVVTYPLMSSDNTGFIYPTISYIRHFCLRPRMSDKWGTTVLRCLQAMFVCYRYLQTRFMCYAIEIQKKGPFKVKGQGQILDLSYLLI